jgi:cyclophilin family peptidyl-prolyl cis-trans isomerase
MADPRNTRNVPLLVAVGAVLVAAIVAVAVGFNHAATTGVTRNSQTAAPASASPSGTASATLVPYADCSTAAFGPTLQPLNPPSDPHVYGTPPGMSIDQTKLYQATITTAKGNIVLCLQPNLAPQTVNVFVTLARNHFYDGIPFHRVVPNFVIQGGDPSCVGHVSPAPATPSGTCGQGGPGFKFNDEPVMQKYAAGCVAMANSGPNTNGSQFFICSADDTSQLQNLYNLFGKVESGMNVVTQIQQGDVMESITVAEQQ